VTALVEFMREFEKERVIIRWLRFGGAAPSARRQPPACAVHLNVIAFAQAGLGMASLR
jgi:hypothetical protein